MVGLLVWGGVGCWFIVLVWVLGVVACCGWVVGLVVLLLVVFVCVYFGW